MLESVDVDESEEVELDTDVVGPAVVDPVEEEEVEDVDNEADEEPPLAGTALIPAT